MRCLNSGSLPAGNKAKGSSPHFGLKRPYVLMNSGDGGVGTSLEKLGKCFATEVDPEEKRELGEILLESLAYWVQTGIPGSNYNVAAVDHFIGRAAENQPLPQPSLMTALRETFAQWRANSGIGGNHCPVIPEKILLAHHVISWRPLALLLQKAWEQPGDDAERLKALEAELLLKLTECAAYWQEKQPTPRVKNVPSEAGTTRANVKRSLTLLSGVYPDSHPVIGLLNQIYRLTQGK